MAEPTEELKEFLVHTPFFAGLWDRGLDWVASTLVERSFSRGTVIFREGEPGRSMYIVKSGGLLASQAGEAGRSCALMHYGPGDFFGEMTLIEMQARPFSVAAESDAVLYELSNMDLYELYRQDIKAYVLVLQNVNRELCRRLRRAGNRLTELASGSGDAQTQIVSRPPTRPAS